ncbi:hypothetical protein ACQJBY_021394 [Aegilops geniculata]
MVQSSCAKHVVFGIPTPPNSGSELSSCKMIFAAMLESTAGSKRCSPDGQDLVLSMHSTSTESLEVRGAMDVSVNCKRVCAERVGIVVGIDGATIHVTEEVDGGVEVDHDKRRESVGDGKDVGDSTKEATGPGVAGQLTCEHDVARQEP